MKNGNQMHERRCMTCRTTGSCRKKALGTTDGGVEAADAVSGRISKEARYGKGSRTYTERLWR